MEPAGHQEPQAAVDEALIEAARQEAISSSETCAAAGRPGGRKSRSGESLDVEIPRRIGQYEITRIVGGGGMGTVYEANQDHPRRRVAIKVLKRNVTSTRLAQRFEYESQILAKLQHPGIAQVHEAGWYEHDGHRVPYFAMEFIEGAKSLVEYANERQLPTRVRLELFVHVCEAVQHGHQRGIIHRDLKPGNVLVDRQGQIKIIDYGVARVTDAEAMLRTFETQYGEMVGTLKYMSPEQFHADPNDLDIRTDIYALGVVLFELLTGRLPYDLDSTPLVNAPRVICEEPPTRLGTIDRSMRGDLETIVNTALEKDRVRRYQSAAGFADDIRRYLHDEPILARPPSAIYSFRKFVHRRRWPLAAAVVLAAVGLAAVVSDARARTTAAVARTAVEERDRLDMTIKVLEMGATIQDFRNEPVLQARALNVCKRALELDERNAPALALRSKIYTQNDDYASALVDCQKALELDPENQLAQRSCAFLYLERREVDKARPLYENSLEGYALSWDLPRDFHNYARILRTDGEYAKALEDHDRAVALAPSENRAYLSRGVTRYMSGDIDGAIADFERAASPPRKRPVRATSAPGAMAVQSYQFIWEARMLRRLPGDEQAAEQALVQAEQAARADPRSKGVIDVWRGRRTATDLLVEDWPRDDQAQMHYFFGVQALVNGDTESAKAHFEKAVDPSLFKYEEYHLATWHLKKLAGR